MVLPTESSLIETGSGPAEVMTLAIPRWWLWANDHSV